MMACAALLPIPGTAQPDFDVVIRARAGLDRNLAACRFPLAMDAPELEQACNLLRPALLAAGLSCCTIGELPDDVRAGLVDRELVARSYAVDDQRYIALHPTIPVWGLFMQREHASLYAQAYGLALDDVCRLLFEVDTAMNRVQSWAFDHDFGYLSSDIDHFGSGLSATLTLHLPALELTGFIELALKQAMDAGFILGGVYGGGRGPAGSLYELSLPNIFAESEATAIERLSRAARTLAAYERNSRKEMLERNNWEILDVIGRACGRAQMARSVMWDECIDIILGLRLGLALDVLEDLSLAEASDLWYTVRTGRRGNASQKPDYAIRADALRFAVRQIRFCEGYQDV